MIAALLEVPWEDRSNVLSLETNNIVQGETVSKFVHVSITECLVQEIRVLYDRFLNE